MFTNNKYKSCNQKEDLETRTDIQYLNILTLLRRKMKRSMIFAKLLQRVPCGMLSSGLFEFLRYLYPFQRYAT